MTIEQNCLSIRDWPVLSIALLRPDARTPPPGAEPAQKARERILDSAYELFSQRGVRAVGVDELIDRASVAKATNLDHPVGRASAGHLENIRSIARTLADEAGLRDSEAFALSWHILMKGSIVQAAEGDRDAAKRAQALSRLLIKQHRQGKTGSPE
jgi:Bacterial regulatory proteins, tetR family